MWRDRVPLKKLKEKNQVSGQESSSSHGAMKQSMAEEQSRRKMSRAQDAILGYMVKIMEPCKAKGFVYRNAAYSGAGGCRCRGFRWRRG
ncbi:hypothetical protein J5N97_005721 [Dioscorea zingiberensis]|uniref:Ethylene insensitive 3-like DNA-binding domain-containing protein n=1 Tax=Dioscorea zingiberensis TaxID=325984 RepID=A0A9D5D8N0_9LILI|nr:hypothetical protein J5N97_005721 [Dioscorea zingiberensis]